MAGVPQISLCTMHQWEAAVIPHGPINRVRSRHLERPRPSPLSYSASTADRPYIPSPTRPGTSWQWTPRPKERDARRLCHTCGPSPANAIRNVREQCAFASFRLGKELKHSLIGAFALFREPFLPFNLHRMRIEGAANGCLAPLTLSLEKSHLSFIT